MNLETRTKRKRNIILIVVAIVVPTLLIIGRMTNAIGFYVMPTPSNFPTIRPGDYIFSSNFISPHRYDFICYKRIDNLKSEIYAHRLCGVEGDTVEIRNGDLIVNGMPADQELTLGHMYMISISDYEQINKDDKDELARQASSDSIMVVVSDKAFKGKSFSGRRLVMPIGYRDEQIGERYSADWNQDQFGPVVVPKGKYFLLGDSRHNSLDSRYRGFIEQSDYIATVIGR